jgi:hypothetical protein
VKCTYKKNNPFQDLNIHHRRKAKLWEKMYTFRITVGGKTKKNNPFPTAQVRGGGGLPQEEVTIMSLKTTSSFLSFRSG